MALYNLNGLIKRAFLLYLLYFSFINGSSKCQNQKKRIIGYFYSDYNLLKPLNHEQANMLTHIIFFCHQCAALILAGPIYYDYDSVGNEIEMEKNNNISVMIRISNKLILRALKRNFEEVVQRICLIFQKNTWLDGIELDLYLYHNEKENRMEEQEHLIFQFICALRHEFNKFDRHLLISLQSGQITQFPNVYSTDWLAKASKYLDFISVYTMDYYILAAQGLYGHPFTFANAPLYSTSFYPHSINDTMEMFICNIDKLEKLNLMIPFNGIIWKNVYPDPIKVKNNELNSIAYKVLWHLKGAEIIAWKSIYKHFETNMEIYHEETETPFIIDKERHEFISYENKRSIAKKIQFMYEYGIGGIHINYINYDDDNNTLLNTIWTESRKNCMNINTIQQRKYNCDSLSPNLKWKQTNFSNCWNSTNPLKTQSNRSNMVNSDTKNNLKEILNLHKFEIIGCLIIIICIIFLCLFYLQRRKNKNEYNSILISNPLELDNEKNNFVSIGKGRFGETFLCELNENKKITIKVMHRQNEWSKRKMAKEMAILKELNHPNICVFHGLTKLDANRIGQIFDYAPLGDLLNFLDDRYSNSMNNKLLIRTPVKLHRISLMIADGLKYLKAENIVHGNLHMKNCVVFEYPSFENENNFIVKLTDFSQMNFIVKADFYKQLMERNLNKFIAPEVLSKQKFSFASDVWSFGSILYCLFSQEELNKLISQRNVMDINEAASSETTNNNNFPSTFPFAIETLVVRCWMHFQQHRIDIADAYNYLLQLDMNDLINKMEINEDDLANIDPTMELDIDTEQFFDAISHSGSIMDLARYLGGEIDDLEENAPLPAPSTNFFEPGQEYAPPQDGHPGFPPLPGPNGNPAGQLGPIGLPVPPGQPGNPGESRIPWQAGNLMEVQVIQKSSGPPGQSWLPGPNEQQSWQNGQRGNEYLILNNSACFDFNNSAYSDFK